MERDLLVSAASVIATGVWLRWASMPSVIAYRVGRRVERINAWQAAARRGRHG